jgi:hypothetical protein
MSSLERGLMRAAILGAMAAAISAALLWLVLTRPAALATAIEQAF